MINTISGVNESLVVERNGKLVALVKFDDNVLDWNQEREDKFFEILQAKKQAVLEYVNKHVSKQAKIGEVEAMKENFEKTATQKIRRFKYKEGEENGSENDGEGKEEDQSLPKRDRIDS